MDFTWVSDIIRDIFWALVKGLLSIVDGVYSITSKIVSLDISTYEIVWNWWTALAMFIFMFVIFRIIAIGIKSYFDEEYREKIDPMTIVNRIFPVCLVILLLPFGVKYLTSMGTIAASNITVFIGGEPDLSPSTIVLSSMMNETVEIDGQTKLKDVKIDEISINEKSSESGKTYVYFDDMSELFMLLIVSAVALYGFFMNSIQLAKRFYSIGMKILISPIPISGLINPEDDSFKTWSRMMVSDVVSNFVQYLMLFFILSISTSFQLRQTVGMWGMIILFIGGILTLLTGVPELARLIGGDTSTGSVMQQLATVRQATSGIGSFVGGIAGGALGAAGGIAATAGAYGTVGIGKMMGAQSISQMGSAMAGASALGSAIGGFGASGAQSQGFQGAESSVSSQAESGTQGKEASGNNTRESTNITDDNPKMVDSPQNSAQTSAQTDFGPQGFAKPGSFADRVASYGYSRSGVRAGVARFASNGGRHIYQSSANRVNQSMPMKLSRKLERLNEIPDHYQQAKNIVKEGAENDV